MLTPTILYNTVGQTHVCDQLYCTNPTVTAHHYSNSHQKSFKFM